MVDIKLFWEELDKKYPTLNDFLDKLYDSQLKMYDAMTILEDNYPVDGYEWDYDINHDFSYKHGNPWFLRPIKVREEADKRTNAALDKQRKCVEGEHHFINITEYIKWCSYCGTLIVNDNNKYFPEVPHFLGSQKPKE